MPRTTNQAKLQLWNERFEQFRQGSQTVQQFCQSLGCTSATFHYWQRKLEPAGQLQTSTSLVDASAFVPVVVRCRSTSTLSRWHDDQLLTRAQDLLAIKLRRNRAFGTELRLSQGGPFPMPADCVSQPGTFPMEPGIFPKHLQFDALLCYSLPEEINGKRCQFPSKKCDS